MMSSLKAWAKFNLYIFIAALSVFRQIWFIFILTILVLNLPVYFTIGLYFAAFQIGYNLYLLGKFIHNQFSGDNSHSGNFFEHLDAPEINPLSPIHETPEATVQLNARYEAALEELPEELSNSFEQEATDNGYKCAINLELMSEPCLAPHNNQLWYEKSALETHVRRTGKNPNAMDTRMRVRDIRIDQTQQERITQFVTRVEQAAQSSKNIKNELMSRFKSAYDKLPETDQQLFEDEAFDKGYFCAASFNIMSEPCLALGNNKMWFERNVVEQYVNEHGTSPSAPDLSMTLNDIHTDLDQQQKIRQFVDRVQRTAACQLSVSRQETTEVIQDPLNCRC